MAATLLDPPKLSDDFALDATLAPAQSLGFAHTHTDETISDAESPAAGGGLGERFNAGRAGKLLGRDLKALLRSTILPRAKTKNGAKIELIIDDRERYERLSSLGEGGVGEVSLVRDNDIERKVAMKRLKSSSLSSADMLRFTEEIRTVGKLEHPSIIPIHDVGIDEDGAYYFIMKHVEGETLEEIIAKLDAGDPAYHARFTPQVRAQIFVDILQAMEFSHSRHIIHRDIKPANVMVGQHGEVMVMDWGLAKSLKSAAKDTEENGAPVIDKDEGSERLFETQHGALLGTPAYMSPEQAQGLNADIDERSDVYSLAALFYELMTLRHYLGEQSSLNSMLMAVLGQTPAFPASFSHLHQDNIRAEFAFFIMRGLEKEPGERYQSVAEMLSTLQMTIAGKFAVQCPITFTKRTGNEMLRLVDQHPYAALTSVVTFILLALFGTYSAIASVF